MLSFGMHFSERLPSTTWEAVPLADAPGRFVWAWYKPGAAPQGVFLRVPEETLRDPLRRQPLTLRSLLFAVGVAPEAVAVWSLYGASYDGQILANPGWDCAIPDPGAAPDPTIAIYLHAAAIAAAPQMPMYGAAPAAVMPETGGGAAPSGDIFSRMEADWTSSIVLEQNLGSAAKQLNSTLMRINSMNRDFSPDEARCSDSQDKRDWQEARRWLRDVASRLSRFLKDYTVGMTSDVGKRNSYEAIFDQYVAPRRKFDGLTQAARDFEAYRKMLQSLLGNMTAANTSAMQDGERRAQQVLTRVSAKIRNSRAKR
jgi:hypothetical protein